MATEGAPKKKKSKKLPNGGLKKQATSLYKEFVTPLAYTAATKNPLFGLGTIAGERAVKGIVKHFKDRKYPKRPKEDKEKNGKKKNYSNKVWKPFGSL